MFDARKRKKKGRGRLEDGHPPKRGGNEGKPRVARLIIGEKGLLIPLLKGEKEKKKKNDHGAPPNRR